MKNKKIELLAPAGGMKQFIAAVENGADAVYLGGKQFNARINASNFDLGEIKEAVQYARLRNVKTYVTMNTLLKDSELQTALDYATSLYNIGVDALIIQDLGLSYILNKYLPDMPLHLSTQGTIYNQSGVKSAFKLGFKRIVLARELSLDEIKSACTCGDIEIFIHGAMCICYSGQCHLSRVMGGRSGNRGECAQPCRLPYTNEQGKKGYFLSPKDICTIDSLDEIIKSGVTSLKIEGRMKTPEYVATVTRIYRKYIDEFYKTGKINVHKEDKNDLLQIFNRGGFTKGYLFENPKKNLFSSEIAKNQGILIGQTIERVDNNLIKVKLNGFLEKGDGIEIYGKETVGNVVTYLENKGSSAIVGDIKGPIEKGSKIYKVTSKKLKNKAVNDSKKNTKKIPISMYFSANIGEHASLDINEGDYKVRVISSKVTEEAINKALSDEIIKRQLSKLGATCYETNHIAINIEQNISLPVSELNNMRREAVEKLSKVKLPIIKPIITPTLKPFKDKLFSLPEGSLVFPIITKGSFDKKISSDPDSVIGSSSSVEINNLGHIDLLKDRGISIYGGSGLNITNKASVSALKTIGILPSSFSNETKDSNDIPLMISEGNIDHQILTNNKGESIFIKRKGDKTYILSSNKKSFL